MDEIWAKFLTVYKYFLKKERHRKDEKYLKANSPGEEFKLITEL
jgi:hypothetical protein